MKAILKWTVPVVLAASVFVGAGRTWPEVKTRDVEMIKSAYMNGYVAALQLDLEEIKKLKNDEALRKKAVEGAAEKYVGVVHSMNNK